MHAKSDQQDILQIYLFSCSLTTWHYCDTWQLHQAGLAWGGHEGAGLGGAWDWVWGGGQRVVNSLHRVLAMYLWSIIYLVFYL